MRPAQVPRAGKPSAMRPAQRLEHSQVVQQLRLHGGFAAGKHQAVEGAVEVGGLAQLDGGAAEGLQAQLVLDEGALQGEDGDGWATWGLLVR